MRAPALAFLFIAILAAPAPAPEPASRFGPQVQVGQPRDGYVGTMRVEPLHGKAGDPFIVTAADLPPNEEFQLI